MNIPKKIEFLRTLENRIMEEQSKRFQLEQSLEYRAIEEKKQALSEQMMKLNDDMIELKAGIYDSRPEYDEMKLQIISFMKESGETAHQGLKVKWKETKVVNSGRLLDELGGDIGTFMEIASVPQVSIKNFCKSNPNIPFTKGLLKRVLDVTGRKIVDVSVMEAITPPKE